MGLRRLVQDAREVRHNLSDLLSAHAEAERKASLELTRSARRFSRRTRKVVDDKLSFSATLMRAGEVTAAHRLLQEVEREVRTEEAALIEQVNEVKAAQSIRRQRITRLRLARTLAFALFGALAMSVSAMGMAINGFLADRSAAQGSSAAPVAARDFGSDLRVPERRPVSDLVRRLQLRGLDLTASQVRRISRIAGPGAVGVELTDLYDILPPSLMQQVRDAIATVNSTTEQATESLDSDLSDALRKVEKTRKQAETTTEETSAPETEEAEEAEAEQPATEEEETRKRRTRDREGTRDGDGNRDGDGRGDGDGRTGGGNNSETLSGVSGGGFGS